MASADRLVLLGLCMALAACGQAGPKLTNAPPPAASATLRPSASPSATSSPTRLPRPTETRPSCLTGSGRIVHAELADPALPRTLPFRIFIPPCAEELEGELPVLYLLHGLTFTDAQWDELGADELAQALINSGQAPPFLIVMPWERLGLEFEDTIMNYLIPYIEQRYGASSDPARRAIGGISRGGGFALRIGLQNPERFGAIGLHSPAVLAPDMFNIPRWVESEPIPDIWIDIGNRDPLRFAVADLRELLDEFGVDYEFASNSGTHNSLYWLVHVGDYLNWYISHWR